MKDSRFRRLLGAERKRRRPIKRDLNLAQKIDAGLLQVHTWEDQCSYARRFSLDFKDGSRLSFGIHLLNLYRETDTRVITAVNQWKDVKNG